MSKKIHYIKEVYTNKYHVTTMYGLCGYNADSWLRKHSNNWKYVNCKKCLARKKNQ